MVEMDLEAAEALYLSSYRQDLNCHRLVVVYAPWCPFCREIEAEVPTPLLFGHSHESMPCRSRNASASCCLFQHQVMCKLWWANRIMSPVVHSSNFTDSTVMAYFDSGISLAIHLYNPGHPHNMIHVRRAARCSLRHAATLFRIMLGLHAVVITVPMEL